MVYYVEATKRAIEYVASVEFSISVRTAYREGVLFPINERYVEPTLARLRSSQSSENVLEDLNLEANWAVDSHTCR